MSKREILIIAALAALAFGLVFYFKEQPSRMPISRAVQQVSPPSKRIAEAKAVVPSPRIRDGRGIYSQEEYERLRQLYPPHKPAANGPLPEPMLKLLADNTKRSLYDQKMWPLVRNVIYGKTSAVENALDTGLTADTEVYLLNPYDANVSLLDLAIEAGQRGVIDILLNHQVTLTPQQLQAPNGQDFPELAPLPEAAQYAEDDVVRLLLDHGANIEQKNELGANQDTALAAAVNGGNVSTVYLLLSDGADVSSALGPDGALPEYLTVNMQTPSMTALRGLLTDHGAKMPSMQ